LPRLIAAKRFAYAGKHLAAGDEFDAVERDAKTLTMIDSARYATRALSAGSATTLHLPKKKQRKAK
jgi:hypothetical protein